MGESLEKIFFFRGSERRRLLGVLYRPPGGQSRATGIVYCHPFAEEQNMAHAVAVKACRSFSEQGFPVLRFDMSGSGDSEGTLEDVTVSSWMEDLQAAVKVLKAEANVDRVALWGLRLGGGLARLHACDDDSVHSLILWEPVLDLSLHIRQFLRRSTVSRIMANDAGGSAPVPTDGQFAKGHTMSVIGYPVAPALFDSFCAVGQQPLRCPTDRPTLVLSISLFDKPSATMAGMMGVLGSGAAVRCDHIEAEPFWDRYFRWECPAPIQHSLQWLGER
ncbi:MAG TPA: alpha/beta fold hydrolase [bacterium]